MTTDDKVMPKKTPLYGVHTELGARMIEFGGWIMPVQYRGIIEEHRTVRSAAGLFDLSHMGEIEVRGPKALQYIQRITTNDAAKLQPGKAQYTLVCLENGGIVDDVVVYRKETDRFLIVVNAANIEKDWAWFEKQADAFGREGITLQNQSDDTVLLAVQGPAAVGILRHITDGIDLQALKFFHAAWADVGGIRTFVSRSGYTGEDGFELYVRAEDGVALWQLLMKTGKERGLVPVGLGARDTLRLEVRLTLYGNDIDETTTPLDAGLGYFVSFDKGEFVGRDALLRQEEAGLERKLVGFVMADRGIPRYGYPIVFGERTIGHVTSGSMSPSLGQEIGMGYVEIGHSEPETTFGVEIRGRARKAKVVKGRFVSPGTK